LKNPLDALEKGRRSLDMKARRGSASPVVTLRNLPFLSGSFPSH
jgi:hypothetical protein